MEKTNDRAGQSLLKATGVIMLIFGILGVLIYALGLAVLGGALYVTKGVFSVSQDLLGLGLLLAASLAELIAGALGVRAAKKPARAGAGLIVWGVLALLLGLAGTGQLLLRGASTPLWELLLGLVLGLAVPLVYLGAVRAFRRSVGETPQPKAP